MVLAVFSFMFFALWAISVLMLKCIGKNSGFLLGAPLKAQFEDAFGTASRQQFATRLLFLAATLILWISAVLLLVRGVSELDKTADNTLLVRASTFLNIVSILLPSLCTAELFTR
jgi:hypothetical protein